MQHLKKDLLIYVLDWWCSFSHVPHVDCRLDEIRKSITIQSHLSVNVHSGVRGAICMRNAD
jgi:hypothetical protein